MDADELLQAIERIIDEQAELQKWQRLANASPRSFPEGKAIAFDKIKELIRRRDEVPESDDQCLPNMNRPFAL